MTEREMEDLLWEHPEKLLNEPLRQFQRQPASPVGRADLIFVDRIDRLLVIELKRGTLEREAIPQLIDYSGMVKHRHPEREVELMIIANRIPSERRTACERFDIEAREIPEKRFRDVADEVRYVFESERLASTAPPTAITREPPMSNPPNIPQASASKCGAARFYYYNIGDGKHRKWEDYVQFGFISAGQGRRWGRAICRFKEGDAFAAYLKEHGFVGVGRILSSAKMIREVKIKGTPLLALPLLCRNMGDHCDDEERSEYVCLVDWLAWLPREQAKRTSGLYTTPLIRASLARQPETVKFIEQEFGIRVPGTATP